MKSKSQKFLKKRSPYLVAEGSANSTIPFKRSIRCRETFRCKRMQCRLCYYYRRNCFISSAATFFRDKGRLIHVVVRFPTGHSREEGISQWLAILDNLPRAAKGLSKKLRSYVRTLGVGEINGNPHVHYIIRERDHKFFEIVVRKVCAKGTSIYVDPERIYNVDGLLGYFFDRNFYPAYVDPIRPRGIRILSGSKGILCGFPRKKKRSV